MSELTAHYHSLRQFAHWSTPSRQETRAQRHNRWRERGREWYRGLCRQQFARTARRLRRLGFQVELPADRDAEYQYDPQTAQTNPPLELPGSLSVSETRTGVTSPGSRFGFGVKRSEWTPRQRANRFKLAAAWFFAVVAVFAGYVTVPGAVAGGGNATPATTVTDTVRSGKAAVSALDARPLGSNKALDSNRVSGSKTPGAYPGRPSHFAPTPSPNPNHDPTGANQTPRTGPQPPTPPSQPSAPGISLNINGFDQRPTTTALVFLLITFLSVAPSLLLMMTSFTKIFIVLAMARNALGLNQIPPTQVLSGLSIFLSLFIMAPTVSTLWTDAIQPYVNGDIQVQDMFVKAEKPLRDFMGPLTREEDIALMTRAANRPNPESLDKTPFTTLVPAFMISEVRSAFIIGFVVFIPFLVIDLVVGAALMSMGMMMLPPVMVSLPFKVLLFVMVDGWGMLTQTLIGTYR